VWNGNGSPVGSSGGELRVPPHIGRTGNGARPSPSAAWMISAPIALEGRHLGWLSANATFGDGFEHHDHVTLRAFARHAAAAMALSKVLQQERRKTEQQAAARVDAERLNRDRAGLVARISHEMRAPLSALVIGAEIIRVDGLPSAKIRKLGSTLEISGRHLLSLIDEVLDLCQIEAGELALRAERIEVASLVDEAVSAAAPLAVKRGVSVHADVPRGVAVAGDRVRLRQVLLGLLANAIKFTPAGGQVGVRAGSDDRSVWIHVTDTGVGIPAADLGRIFEPFERGASEQAGPGLGLAIARRIVELHQGTIAATSGPEPGSTFSIELPAPGRRTAAARSAAAPARKRPARAT